MLNQLCGLSSPPLSITPLTIISTGHRDEDLDALRAAAPNTVVRGGARGSLRALANSNTVVVLDRCGRVVYQQTLKPSDAHLQSVEAAILSAHLDDPCGPCHLPAQQEEPSHGHLDQIQDKTTSQAKMSSIANEYASSSVANNPTDNSDIRHNKAVVEDTPDDRRDEAEEETVSETTRKPDRKKKKNKRKKGKQEKQKKRKRVEEAAMSTSKATETAPNEENAGPADEIDKLIALSETANEILGGREIGYVAVETTDAAPRPFPPSSSIVWPYDKRYSGRDKKKQKNGKQARADLEREIDEGIEIVKEEEELVEYHDAIEADDNILVDIEEAVDKPLVSDFEEMYRGAENGVSRQYGGADNDRDEEGLITDILTDERVAVPDETGYPSEREQEEQSRRELMGNDDVWGTYSQDESKDVGEKKKQTTSKDVSKKRKKEEKGKYKRVERVQEEERHVRDDWVGSDEADSQKYVLRRVTGEMDGGVIAERETDGARFAEREMEEDTVAEWETDGGRFTQREADEDTVAERETDAGKVAEREPESTPLYATWRDLTIAPTEHDSRSSGGYSDDQTRRVVVYESQGDYSASDKVEQLHSKIRPWTKGKHY